MGDNRSDPAMAAIFDMLEATGYLERTVCDGQIPYRLTANGVAALVAQFGNHPERDGPDHDA